MLLVDKAKKLSSSVWTLDFYYYYSVSSHCHNQYTYEALLQTLGSTPCRQIVYAPQTKSSVPRSCTLSSSLEFRCKQTVYHKSCSLTHNLLCISCCTGSHSSKKIPHVPNLLKALSYRYSGRSCNTIIIHLHMYTNLIHSKCHVVKFIFSTSELQNTHM